MLSSSSLGSDLAMQGGAVIFVKLVAYGPYKVSCLKILTTLTYSGLQENDATARGDADRSTSGCGGSTTSSVASMMSSTCQTTHVPLKLSLRWRGARLRCPRQTFRTAATRAPLQVYLPRRRKGERC